MWGRLFRSLALISSCFPSMLTQTRPRISFGLASHMRRLLSLFLLQDGRKVGLGLWILLLSCIFLATDKIAASDWITCLFLSTALVGGGNRGGQIMVAIFRF